jgi:hypothetical protein
MHHIVVIRTNSDATIGVACSCGSVLADDLDGVYFDELQILVIGHRVERVLPTADTAARCERAEAADVRKRMGLSGSGWGLSEPDE